MVTRAPLTASDSGTHRWRLASAACVLGVVLSVLATAAAPAPAQEPAQADTGHAPRVRLVLPVTLPDLRVPASLKPGGIYGPRLPPAIVADQWLARLREALARATRERAAARLAQALAPAVAEVPPDTARPAIAIPRPEDFLQPERPRTFEALASYADLGIDLNTRLELKMDRLRNARCTAAEINDPSLGCQGGFPAPSLDQEFRVRAGGIVSNRVNVAVDFDSEREFSANNNINVFYQGLEDEILRRIEIGNVTFRAPASRFITSAVPGNSFGVQADAQLGPVEITSILAQQKGSALRTREFTVGQETTQPVSLEAKDLDFEAGRFFFSVDPRAFPGYPAVDVLNLLRDTLPPEIRLAALRVYRLRAQSGQSGVNPNLGGIDAVAVRYDSPQRVGPFSWELLVEGQDYYLDPSGTWFALATRLGSEDFLAVSYVRVAGDTVGTFPAVNGTGDTLLLIHEPRRGPEVPTFSYEMRNFYRVGGQDVERTTVQVTLTVGNSETPLDRQGTYLQRLGLAEPVNPSVFDQYNRLFPRERDPGGRDAIQGFYVAFPHLAPFADSARLEAPERNDSLYRTPTYLLRTQGPPSRFTIAVDYEAAGGGDRATLSIGSIQIRAGSERIYVADRRLQREVDYTIDYGIGQVRFLDPDRLFTGPTRVRVEYEENQLFDEAPKSLIGFATRYHLGFGSLNAIGIYQGERTISTRPTLGFEPEAIFVGGVSGDFEFRGEGLTRALDALPLVHTTVPSRLTVNGEVAVSAPNANRARVAYVEDFERESAFGIALTERLFQRGSAPSSPLGLPAPLVGATGGFDPSDAVPVVWQNFVATSAGSSLQFRPQDIDTSIVLVGQGTTYEAVLWLTLKPDTVGGIPNAATGEPRWVRPHTPGPRWASMTQPLGSGSGVGADLSRVEYLEFWMLEDATRSARDLGTYVIFDFGSVFEDAVAAAPQAFRVVDGDTLYSGVQFVGQGALDTEKDSLTNVFNAHVDDRGIHGDLVPQIVNDATGDALEGFPVCDNRGLSGLTAFYLGDLAARCTRGNGFLDTEDLDGDNRLDVNVGTTQEDFVRYVFPVGDERFFVREGTALTDATGGTLRWRLYRIPFRADSLQVGQPNLRHTEALRITMVAPDEGGPGTEFWVSLARVRLVGAPWIKRATTPLLGLAGNTAVPHGEVIASIVTTENSDLGYVPPPGAANLPENVNVGLGIGQVQVNEKSLRLVAADLRAGERAEALVRFTTEADRNFLKYGTLRVWARGRGAGWAEGDLEFYLKVGRDENNFYLFRAPARTDSWEPEAVVDLGRWLALRAEIESRWLRGEPPSGAAECGGDTTAYVACDGGYLVHVRDPATSPPSLAQVSEVSVGLLRVAETVAISEAELWVDDIRLSDVVDDAGYATALDVRLAAADVAEASLSLSRRDDRFRQIDTDPTYVTDAVTRIAGAVRLDKFLPAALGLAVPLSVQYTRSASDPYYVSRSDIVAGGLEGLRRPRSTGLSVDLTLRRARRGGDFLTRTFVDPVGIHLRRDDADNVASLSSFESRSRLYQIDYSTQFEPVTLRIVPRFIVDLLNALPSWIRDSEFGRALRSSRLRLNPYRIRFTSGLVDNTTDRFVYRVPVILPGDSALRPVPSAVHTWRNDAGLDLRPFTSLTLSGNLSSLRDLQRYGDTTTVGRLLEGHRKELFGQDVGFERQRTLATALSLTPPLTAWLTPRLSWATTFTFSRDPNRQDALRVEGDTAGAFRVAETVTNGRRRELGMSLDLARLGRGIAGDSGIVARLFRGILPAVFSSILERQSSFDRAPFAADWRYQLAIGGTEAFLEQAGTPASGALVRTTNTASGGARLPLGALVRLSYREVASSNWQRRTDRLARIDQRMRDWPSLNVSWTFTPPRVMRSVLTGMNAQGLYREQVTSSLLPPLVGEAGGEPVRAENSSVTISPSVSLTWRGGIVTTGRWANTDAEALTSGNRTLSGREEWGGSANFSFLPPRSLVRLPNRIQTTVAYSASVLSVCLIRSGSDECRTVSDSRRHQLDLRMDTGLSSAVRGGMTFSYIVNDQRHLSQKLSQTVFSIFGELTLTAGQVR